MEGTSRSARKRARSRIQKLADLRSDSFEAFQFEAGRRLTSWLLLAKRQALTVADGDFNPRERLQEVQRLRELVGRILEEASQLARLGSDDAAGFPSVLLAEVSQTLARRYDCRPFQTTFNWSRFSRSAKAA